MLNQPLAVCDKTAGALASLNRKDIFISESTYHYDGGGCLLKYFASNFPKVY